MSETSVKIPSAIVFHKTFDSEHERGMVVTDSETVQKFWTDEHLRTFVHAFAAGQKDEQTPTKQ